MNEQRGPAAERLSFRGRPAVLFRFFVQVPRYPYLGPIRRKKPTVTAREAISAARPDSQIPSRPRTRGRRRTAPVSKTRVRRKEITADTTFESLHLDSLDTVEMLMDLENELGIDLEIEDKLSTVGELADFIESKLD